MPAQPGMWSHASVHHLHQQLFPEQIYPRVQRAGGLIFVEPVIDPSYRPFKPN